MRASGNTLPAAIVVGLDSMQGLQAARILHGHGVPVTAIADDRRHPACRTNTCQRIVYCDTGTAALIDVLLEIATTLAHKAVLFPCQDKSVRIVSRQRERLADSFEIVLPSSATLEMLMDKDAFYDHAVRNGLRVPATHELRSRDDAIAVAEHARFPCVLKPSHRAHKWDEHSKKKVFRVRNAAELIACYDTCKTWAATLIAQQWVRGGDENLYSCNCYYSKQGQALVTFVARKLRQWPPEAGSSCLGEEVRDDVVLDTTLSLFDSLKYRGLGYLEIKRDTVTGEYFIIEPNVGRPTGRSAIAETGGVALLYTMYCDALDLPLPPNRTQQYRGVKWIDLRHDLQSALWYWREGRLSLRDWLRSMRGRKAHAVLSWRDPRPFLADLKMAATMLFAR